MGIHQIKSNQSHGFFRLPCVTTENPTSTLPSASSTPKCQLDLLSNCIVPTKMTLCKFFAQGFCRNGDSCSFIHESRASTGLHLMPSTETPNLKPAAVSDCNGESKPAQNCRFFLQGKCSKGKECRYIHPPAILSPQQVCSNAIFMGSPQLPTDSRASVPCRFLSSFGGCQNTSCPYLHVAEKSIREDLEANEEEASNRFSEFGGKLGLIS